MSHTYTNKGINNLQRKSIWTSKKTILEENEQIFLDYHITTYMYNCRIDNLQTFGSFIIHLSRSVQNQFSCFAVKTLTSMRVCIESGKTKCYLLCVHPQVQFSSSLWSFWKRAKKIILLSRPAINWCLNY